MASRGVTGRAHGLLNRFVPASRIPALWIVLVYCVLLLGIPSRLVVGPIGAAGTPANLWGLLALVWWICATLGGLNHAPRHSPIRVVLGILAVCVTLSYISATLRGWYVPADVREATSDIFDLAPATLQQVRATSLDAADRGLISFASWLGIALVAADGLRSWTDLDRVVKCLSVMGAFMGGIGLLQYFFGINIASLFKLPGLVANDEFGAIDARSVVRRVQATAIHPIEFGVVLATIFPLALHRAIYHAHSKSALIPTLLIGLAIPVAVSRSAILVLTVTMVVLFIGWPPRWRLRAILIAPVSVVVIRVLMPGVVGTTIAFFTHVNEDPSVSGRTDDYEIAFRVFSENPWFGRGLFTFIPRYYRILDNQYLRLMLEVGLFGMLAVMLMFIVAWGCARGARLRSSSGEHRHLSLALSASIAGLSLSYATLDAWSAPITAGITFLLVGLAAAARRVAMGGVGVESETEISENQFDPASR